MERIKVRMISHMSQNTDVCGLTSVAMLGKNGSRE